MSSSFFAVIRQYLLSLSIPSNAIGHTVLTEALAYTWEDPLQLSAGEFWLTLSQRSGRSRDQLRACVKRTLAHACAYNEEAFTRLVGMPLPSVDPTRFLFSSYWLLTGNRLPLLFSLKGALSYGDVSLLLLRQTHSFAEIARLWRVPCSVLSPRYEKKRPILAQLLQDQRAGKPLPYLMYQYCVDEAQLLLLHQAFDAEAFADAAHFARA